MEANIDWKARAAEAFGVLDQALKEFDLTAGFVMRTGFVTWLNLDVKRQDRYIAGDVISLAKEFIDECVLNDFISEEELED